ncbi:MAG: hypothetical protein WCO30_01710 [bacterium]
MIKITRSSIGVSSQGSGLGTIIFSVGDGTNIIQAGTRGYTPRIPKAFTIVSMDIAEVSTVPVASTAVIDILKGAYASYPTCTSITASAKPTLTASAANSDQVLTGWTKTVADTEFLAFNVNSNDVAKKILLTLTIQK